MLTILHTQRRRFVFRVATAQVHFVRHFSTYTALTQIVTFPHERAENRFSALNTSIVRTSRCRWRADSSSDCPLSPIPFLLSQTSVATNSGVRMGSRMRWRLFKLKPSHSTLFTA